MEPAVGIEPTTSGLQNQCSTVELRRRPGSVYTRTDTMALVDLREMAMLRYGVDGEVPVCPRCSALVSPLDHYCAECHAPQGLTPSIPFVVIWVWADFLARIADSAGRRSWPSIVVSSC